MALEGIPAERPDRPDKAERAPPVVDLPVESSDPGFDSGLTRRQHADSIAAAVKECDGIPDDLAGSSHLETSADESAELVTRPSGETGGIPDGKPTRIESNQEADACRALARENSTAVFLADQGYQIKQNPSPAEIAHARQTTGDTGDPQKNPDYLLEGRVFDCYSPKEDTTVRNIWSTVGEKIGKGQTQRVVVNLEDWRGDLSELRQQFQDWPINNLKELKAITPEGDLVQLIPDQQTPRRMPDGA